MSFKNIEIQQEQNLSQQFFQAQTDLLLSQQENQSLGQQLFDLQTQLVQKGVI